MPADYSQSINKAIGDTTPSTLPANDYGSSIDKVLGPSTIDPAAKIKANLYSTSNISPDVAIKQYNLSEASKVPIATVRNRMDDIQKFVSLDSIDTKDLLSKAPNTANHLADPAIGPAIKDDVKPLSAIERYFSSWDQAGSQGVDIMTEHQLVKKQMDADLNGIQLSPNDINEMNKLQARKNAYKDYGFETPEAIDVYKDVMVGALTGPGSFARAISNNFWKYMLSAPQQAIQSTPMMADVVAKSFVEGKGVQGLAYAIPAAAIFALTRGNAPLANEMGLASARLVGGKAQALAMFENFREYQETQLYQQFREKDKEGNQVSPQVAYGAARLASLPMALMDIGEFSAVIGKHFVRDGYVKHWVEGNFIPDVMKTATGKETFSFLTETIKGMGAEAAAEGGQQFTQLLAEELARGYDDSKYHVFGVDPEATKEVQAQQKADWLDKTVKSSWGNAVMGAQGAMVMGPGAQVVAAGVNESVAKFKEVKEKAQIKSLIDITEKNATNQKSPSIFQKVTAKGLGDQDLHIEAAKLKEYFQSGEKVTPVETAAIPADQQRDVIDLQPTVDKQTAEEKQPAKPTLAKFLADVGVLQADYQEAVDQGGYITIPANKAASVFATNRAAYKDIEEFLRVSPIAPIDEGFDYEHFSKMSDEEAAAEFGVDQTEYEEVRSKFEKAATDTGRSPADAKIMGDLAVANYKKFSSMFKDKGDGVALARQAMQAMYLNVKGQRSTAPVPITQRIGDMDLALENLRANKPEKQTPIIGYLLAHGGVRIGSNLAGELKHMGINNKTYPGLFKKKGYFSDIDNIVASEFQNELKLDTVPSEDGYVSKDWVLEQLRLEDAGKPLKSAAEAAKEQALADLSNELHFRNIDINKLTNEQIKEKLNEPIDDAAYQGGYTQFQKDKQTVIQAVKDSQIIDKKAVIKTINEGGNLHYSIKMLLDNDILRLYDKVAKAIKTGVLYQSSYRPKVAEMHENDEGDNGVAEETLLGIYGTTEDPNNVAFITKDGQWVAGAVRDTEGDRIGESIGSKVHHHDMAEAVFNEMEYGDYEDALTELFRQSGVVRFSGPDKVIAAAYMPTPEQMRELRKLTKKLGDQDWQISYDAPDYSNSIYVLNSRATPANIKRVFEGRVRERGEQLFQSSQDMSAAAFKEWFDKSWVDDEDGNPLPIYIGSTHDITSFDPSKSNPENDFGKGIYASNSAEDVAENYAGEGPDLTNRIQALAEKIASETDREYDDPAVEEEARKQLTSNKGTTYKVYMSLQNPVVLGGPFQTEFEMDIEDEDSDYTGSLIDFLDSLRSVGNQYDNFDYDKVAADVMEASNYVALNASKLVEVLKKSEGLAYAEDDNYQLAGNEIIRAAFEDMGFDGIIDNTVNRKFGSGKVIGKPMAGMDEDTTHYIAFKSNQVKSVFNRGTYSKQDDNILFQSSAAETMNYGIDGFYSELFKSIQDLKFEKGTAKQWRDLIYSPAAKGKRAIRDENNKPTGKVEEYDMPESMRLAKVRIGEYIWSGLDNYLQAQMQPEPKVILIRAQEDKGYLNQVGEYAWSYGTTQGQFELKTGIAAPISQNGMEQALNHAKALIKEQGIKHEAPVLTKQDILSWLKENKLEVRERVLDTTQAAEAGGYTDEDVHYGVEERIDVESDDPVAFDQQVDYEEELIRDDFGKMTPEEYWKENPDTSYVTTNADDITSRQHKIDQLKEWIAAPDTVNKEDLQTRLAGLEEAQKDDGEPTYEWNDDVIRDDATERARNYYADSAARKRFVDVGNGAYNYYITYDDDSGHWSITDESTGDLIDSGDGRNPEQLAIDTLYEYLHNNDIIQYPPEDSEEGNTKYHYYQRDGEKEEYTEIIIYLPSITDTGVRQHDWPEENVLMHIRFNTRRDKDGKKIMFVEEIQSDWHQQGRDNGYRDPAVAKELTTKMAQLTGEFEDKYRREIKIRNLNIPKLGSQMPEEVFSKYKQVTPELAQEYMKLEYEKSQQSKIWNEKLNEVNNSISATMGAASNMVRWFDALDAQKQSELIELIIRRAAVETEYNTAESQGDKSKIAEVSPRMNYEIDAVRKFLQDNKYDGLQGFDSLKDVFLKPETMENIRAYQDADAAHDALNTKQNQLIKEAGIERKISVQMKTAMELRMLGVEDRIIEEYKQLQEEQVKATKGVAKAPFSDLNKYTELGIKRVISWAVANGFDKVAWTTGEQQAERYSSALQRVVREIAVSPETTEDQAVIRIISNSGQPIGEFIAEQVKTASVNDKGFVVLPAKELKGIVGEKVAEDIIQKGKQAAADRIKNAPEVERLDKEFAQAKVKEFGFKSRMDDIVNRLHDEGIINRVNVAFTILTGSEGEQYFGSWGLTPEEQQTVIDYREARDNALLAAIERDKISDVATIQNLDITISDKGMKEVYDKVIPNITNGLIRKYDSKVSVMEMPTGGTKQGVIKDTLPSVENIKKYKRKYLDMAANVSEEFSKSDIEYAQKQAAIADDFLKAIEEGQTINGWATENAEFAMPHAMLEELGVKFEDVPEFTKQLYFDVTDKMKEGIPGGQTLFQGEVQYYGSYSFDKTKNQSIISAFEAANKSTFLHEMAHMFLRIRREMFEQYGDQMTDEAKSEWQAVLDWLGSKDGVITREMDEKFARSFELYLERGIAPSIELQSTFEKIRSWLVNLWDKLPGLKPKDQLSKEVVDIMDRMLATSDEIDQMKNHSVFKPDPNMRKILTKAEYEAYVRNGEKPIQEGKTKLLVKSMREKRREQTKWYKKVFAEVTEEITHQVNQSPLFRAVQFLKTGKYIDQETPEGTVKYKIDKNVLVKKYGPGIENLLPKGILTTRNGVHPAAVADEFGFDSEGAMIEAMMNLPDRKAVIAAQVQAEMTFRYGNMMLDGTVEDKALEAMHNEARANNIEYELHAINRKAKQIVATKKEYEAESTRIIGSKAVKTLKPRTYYRNEVAAAQKAAKFLAKEDYVKAAEWKGKQLLNHYLFKHSSQAVRYRDKKMKEWKKFLARSEKKIVKSMDIGYANAIKGILSDHGIGKNQFDFKAWLNELLMIDPQAAEKLQYAIAISNLPEKKNWSALTFNEFTDLADGIKNLEFVGRETKNIEINGKKMTTYEAVQKLSAQLYKNIGKKETTFESERSTGKYIQENISDYLGLSTKAQTYIQRMDGGDDFGFMFQALRMDVVQGEAAWAKRSKMEGTKLTQILQKYFFNKLTGVDNLFDKRDAVYFPEIKDSLTKGQILTIAMNYGNKDNKARLNNTKIVQKDGTEIQWNEEIVKKILSTLSESDWNFVQDIWDYLDSFWPEIAKDHLQRFGFIPGKVAPEAFKFKTKDGKEVSMKGGYFPLVYDPERSVKIQGQAEAQRLKELAPANYSIAQTRQGHKEARLRSVGYPLLFDFSSILGRHIEQVSYDLAVGKAIDKSRKIMNHPEFIKAMQETVGSSIYKNLDLWLKDTAVGPNYKDNSYFGRKARFLRTTYTAGRLSLRFSTALMQFTGLAQSKVILGNKYMRRGAVDFVKLNQKESWGAFAAVREKSVFMDSNFDTINRDVATAINASRGRGLIQTANETMMLPMMGAQYMVNVITWLGGYAKGIEEKGMNEKDAVRYADLAVEKSQGSGLSSTLSMIERGTVNSNIRMSETIKIWTTLKSYFYTKINIAMQRADQTNFKDANEVAKLVGDYVVLFFFDAVITALILGQLPDDDDEDKTKEYAMYFLSQGLSNATAGLPGLDLVAGQLAGYGSTPGAVKELTELGKFGYNTGKILTGNTDENFNWHSYAKSSVTAAAFGIRAKTGLTLPAAQINDFINGMARADRGEDTSALDYLRYNPNK